MKSKQKRETTIQQLCKREQLAKHEPSPDASRWFRAPAYGGKKAEDVTGYLRRQGIDVRGEIR